jgi:hypothetical protein
MTASQIAWVRIKVLLVALKRCFGWILVSAAMLGLLSIAVRLLLGELAWFEGPYIATQSTRFDCSTWWGTSVLVLIDLFMLAWGRDFLPKAKLSHRA